MKVAKNIQISLLFIATLGIMSGITIVSSLPLISSTFLNIPNIEFLSKLMLTIPSIIIALFAPIAGKLVDKYGRLKLLYIGILLFVIGGSSGFYLHDFYIILFGRAILGFGVAITMTVNTTLIADYFCKKRSDAFMAKQGLIIALSGIVLISLGGFLAQIHWSYPFAVYLVPLLFLPFIYKSLYEPQQQNTIQSEVSNENLTIVYITAFFVMVLFYMLPTQLPYLIVNKLGGKPQTVGLVIATAMLFNALIAIFYTKIKVKLTYIQIYAITFLLFSSGLYLISISSNIKSLFFATAPMGMAFGLLLVNTNSWFLSKVGNKNKGKASGILTSSLFLGQFASPIIFFPIVSKYGIQELFFVVSIIAIVISITLFIFIFLKKDR